MYTNRSFILLVAIALVIVGTITIREAIATAAITFDAQAREARRFQYVRDISAERWEAMGKHYAKEQTQVVQHVQQGQETSTARWVAMGEYYTKLQEYQRLKRSREASAARWVAMGEYYAKRDKAKDH